MCQLPPYRRSLTVREAVYEGIFGTPKTEAGLRRVPLSVGATQLIDTTFP